MESATISEVPTSNDSEVGAVGRKYRYLTLKSRSHKKVFHFPLLHVICAPTKFEVTTFNGLGGDACARNVMDGRMDVLTKRFFVGKVANNGQTDRR